MKQKHLSGILAGTCIVVLAFFAGGCQEKDVFNQDNNNGLLPDESTYFGFETRKDVNLSVNYDLAGMKTLIEVFAEDPIEYQEGTPVKKNDIEALFKIYTDDNGKFEGKIEIPTAVKTVYLYTSSWGLPRCMELEVENGSVTFDKTQVGTHTTKAATKAVTKSYPFPESKAPIIRSTHRHNFTRYANGEAMAI